MSLSEVKEENIYCPKCGKLIPEDSGFCQYCGAEISNIEAEQITDKEEYPTITETQPNETDDNFEEIDIPNITAEDEDFHCPKCGKIIPEDSGFCQYCGAEISNIDAEQINSKEEKPAITETQPNETDDNLKGTANPYLIKTDEKSLSTNSQPANKTKRITTPIIALIVITVLLAGLNIFQFASYSKDRALVGELQTALSEKDATIQAKDKTISEKDSKITSLNSKISELQNKADSYQRIVSGLGSGSIGSYSSDFRASTGVIVLNSGSSKTITLTTTLPYDASVHIENDYPSVATADFASDSWYDSVNITVRSKKKGTTILKFVEESNNISFKVLVIVV